MYRANASLIVVSFVFPTSPLLADVIELSSGEDDPIVSTESAQEEDENEPSSAHANQPDSQGRVLVNLNHTSAEEDIFLSPQLARAVKPHQVLLLLHFMSENQTYF